MIYKRRDRTKLKDIANAFHLFFDGLSLRKITKALSRFIKKSLTTVRDWIQKYKPTKKLSYLRKKIEYIIDETLIKVGSKYFWLWVISEPKDKEIPSITIFKERVCLWQKDFYQKL